MANRHFLDEVADLKKVKNRYCYQCVKKNCLVKCSRKNSELPLRWGSSRFSRDILFQKKDGVLPST